MRDSKKGVGVRLVYFEISAGNFGDDLNTFLWPRLLPGAFNGTAKIPLHRPTDKTAPDDELFVGIGTLLMKRLPQAGKKFVFGSGVGYDDVPSIDENMEIHCVRGPMTARVLGLPENLGITDPAILIRLLPPAAREKRYCVSFMPHWFMAETGVWQQICHALNIHFIDPRWSPVRVLRNIAETETLITEALHGAIVADALRVPWMAVSSGDIVLDFKWKDWCETIGITYAPARIPAIWKPRKGIAGHLVTAAKAFHGENVLSRIIQKPKLVLSKDGVSERLTQRLVDVLEAFSRQRNLTLNLNPQYAPGTPNDAVLEDSSLEAV